MLLKGSPVRTPVVGLQGLLATGSSMLATKTKKLKGHR